MIPEDELWRDRALRRQLNEYKLNEKSKINLYKIFIIIILFYIHINKYIELNELFSEIIDQHSTQVDGATRRESNSTDGLLLVEYTRLSTDL